LEDLGVVSHVVAVGVSLGVPFAGLRWASTSWSRVDDSALDSESVAGDVRDIKSVKHVVLSAADLYWGGRAFSVREARDV
jgi:hypothetical protein